MKREIPEKAEVGEDLEIRLVVMTEKPRRLQVEVADDLPVIFAGAPEGPDRVDRTDRTAGKNSREAEGFPVVRGRLEGRHLVLPYSTRAGERGRYLFRCVSIRYGGGLGLWKKQTVLEHRSELRIYPDLSNVRGVLGSMQNALILEGTRLFRKHRGGSDFSQVREYVQGMSPATSTGRRRPARPSS
ncbi:hypothetical protein N6H14_02705 [Paenibacillus sp. CC-CFT747]|nr:hypothetical protein N6H14_02705 [Paenibacillus sp. CC-CFT747]